MNNYQVDKPVQVILTKDFIDYFRTMIREELALAALKAEQKAKHGEKMRLKRGGSQRPL